MVAMQKLLWQLCISLHIKKKKKVIAEKNGQSRIGSLPSEKQACTL